MNKVKLSEVVVRRKVPMTEQTCDSLRKVKKAYEAKLLETTGEEYSLPFPVVIDFMIKEYMEKVYENTITPL